MSVADRVLDDFHRVLLEEIRARRPEYLREPFTVAEIYQNLVPYGSHRERIGVEINGDYEDALLRLLAGEGGRLILESERALRDLRAELKTTNPNTGLYREFAAVDVRLNPAHIDEPSNGAGKGRELDPPAMPGKGATELARGGADADTVAEGALDEAAAADAPSCRRCHAALPTRANLHYCPFCGADVRVVECASCGEELDPGWRFCISCGAEVSG